jgi:hypothetical protein
MNENRLDGEAKRGENSKICFLKVSMRSNVTHAFGLFSASSVTAGPNK